MAEMDGSPRCCIYETVSNMLSNITHAWYIPDLNDHEQSYILQNKYIVTDKQMSSLFTDYGLTKKRHYNEVDVMWLFWHKWKMM